MSRKPLALVIEDDETTARLMRTILEDADFDVRVASTPIDAAREIRRAEPDIIFADVVLGHGLDGATTAAVLKGSVGAESMPLILVSALPAEELRVLQVESGACDAVEKPFHAADLAERALYWLKRSRQGSP